jgi:F-type H+-transporting ATPase subunit delta
LNRSDPAARCYAEALLLMARERNRLEPVLDDLRAVMDVFHADRRLWGLFASPRIDRVEKEAFIRKAFKGRVGPETEGLLAVLVRKSREPIYDNIVDQFIRFRDVEQKRIHVHVASAKRLDDAVRKSLAAAVEEASGKHVELHESVDESLPRSPPRRGPRVTRPLQDPPRSAP